MQGRKEEDANPLGGIGASIPAISPAARGTDAAAFALMSACGISVALAKAIAVTCPFATARPVTGSVAFARSLRGSIRTAAIAMPCEQR